jgi:cytochrome c-type biogenesis protein
MKFPKKTSLIFIFSGFFLIAISFYDMQLISVNADEFYPAPDYQAITLDNEVVSLTDYKGKVILVNLWATWCEPCRDEMPLLEDLSQTFSHTDFEVIGVSIDETGFEKKIQQILDSGEISYEIWLDPSNKFQFKFRTIGVPESFLIDREGMIVHQWKGEFDPMSEETINIVESTIEGKEFELSSPSILNDGIIAGAAIAFSAGVLSFLSPCVLPLIPVYTSLITGLGIKELSKNSSLKSNQRLKFAATGKGVLFVIGFSIIFILLGTTVSFIGTLFLDAMQWIERIGGVILIVLGLHMAGIIHIKRLERQMSFDMAKRNSGKFGPLIVGMAFGAGWTPCIGPILAGILTIAATSSSVITGAGLLGIYSAGLAIPFLISAVAIDRFLIFFSKIKTKLLLIEKISGFLFIGFGIVLLTGTMTLLNNFFNQ